MAKFFVLTLAITSALGMLLVPAIGTVVFAENMTGNMTGMGDNMTGMTGNMTGMGDNMTGMTGNMTGNMTGMTGNMTG